MNEPPATQSPAFKAMVAAAQRGEYEVLLVAYTSRFIRDLALALHYRRVFHRAGVVIFMCDDGILTSDDRDWERFVEKCKAAEVSSRDQSKNVRSGLMTKKVRYRDPGGLPPLGFRRRKDASKLMEPDPDALGTVRRAFELSASGIIDREIAAELSLTVHVVRGTLRSPLYIGRLQDGTLASWQPVISVDLWNKVQVVRSARATTAGHPASPSRPYALSGRLKCRACGKGLIGDTGFYRHNDACRTFRRATPERPPGWHGRKDGKGYRREAYEDAIGDILGLVSLNADQLVRVVSKVAGRNVGPDRIALKRIEQERQRSAQKVLVDRDYEAMRVTLERLDRETAEAEVARVVTGVPARAAVRYLRDLSKTWRLADGGAGRKRLVEALFETVDVLGFRELSLHLTPDPPNRNSRSP